MGDVAEQALRDLLAQEAKNHKWDPFSIKITPISSGGANYTSTLFLASVSAAIHEEKLFAKVACIGGKIRENMNAIHFFQVEKYIYNELMTAYSLIEEEHKVPEEHRLYFPKYYAHSSEENRETLVLEDLTVRGYGMYDRLKPVTWEYASEAITQLAKWHALSFAYEAQHPEEFRKAAEFLKFQLPPESPEAAEAFKRIVEGSAAAAREDNQPVLKRFLANVMECFVGLNSPGSRPVLAHGDYRVSNLLHRRRNGKLQIVPVDYQTVHTGNVGSDLAYFIFTGTDRKFRRLYYKNLIEHYYKQLGSSLQRLGLDVADTYPRKLFNEDLNKALSFVMIVGIIVLPIVLVDVESAPTMSGDFEDMAIKPTNIYSERLNEMIDDLVDWGVL